MHNMTVKGNHPIYGTRKISNHHPFLLISCNLLIAAKSITIKEIKKYA
jgi:hypothetical protein